MSQQIEDVVKRGIPRSFVYFAWLAVIGVSLAALLLSGLAYQRSKLDNDTLQSIDRITQRLERTANRLDEVATKSAAFNRGQSDYLHNQDRELGGSYNDVDKTFNTNGTANDDGSNSWLFTQDDGQRSKQLPGDQKSGNSN